MYHVQYKATTMRPFSAILILSVVLLLLAQVSIIMSGRPGGTGDVKPADKESQQIADQVRAEVEAKVGRKFDQFTVVAYKTQVVAGLNYFMKISVGNDEYIHIRVYQSLSQEIQLHGYQLNKTMDDPIEYFEAKQ